MAKINWSKHKYHNKQYDYDHQRELDAYDREKRWAQQSGKITFGKYKGKKIKSLNTGYLIWLTKNVTENNWNKSILTQAKQELMKRTEQKVGGPVINTAVEKVTHNHTRDTMIKNL
jgi:hypothetical protein